MRYLAQILALGMAYLVTSQPGARAQEKVCPRPSTNEDQPSGPEISIVEVAFSGTLQMPLADQELIAASVKQETHGNVLDSVVEEARERVRAGWQDRGYFKVLVSGDSKILTSGPVSQRIALGVKVEEGLQYTLSAITFKNNRVLTNVKALRSIFLIKDGDIFSRAQIATGLENLRRAYGEYGYINFTVVPNTRFDDDNKTASLELDVDEGKQFLISNLNVIGLDVSAQHELLKDSPIRSGQIYNGRLLELFLQKHGSMFPDCECRDHVQKRLDERRGTVELTFDARPCSVD
jgi:outer membrane protein insertion porin family